MSTIGKKIREQRIALGLTQQELATKLGYTSRASINKIELGINDIAQSKIVAFAKALNTTPAYLMGWSETSTPNSNNVNSVGNLFPVHIKKIPLLGEIACGEPIFASEDLESYVLSGTELRADFCLKAKGDSMINARIHDGDIVFIRKQSMVNNGEIAAVIIDDEATLKRVYYHPEIQELILNSENPKYRPFVFRGIELEKVQILGKAIAFQSDIR